MEFVANPLDGPFPGRQVVHLPAEVSARLPSRGMVIASVNNLTVMLEPNGLGSHWFLVPAETSIEGECTIEVLEVWPEPEVPADLKAILCGQAEATWQSLTPAARWDWIRWVSSTKVAATRQKRIESIPSRLAAGKRRPCCFDRSQCTLTDVRPAGPQSS